ncbi:TetR/AcrR family transcriptional regulator [Nocardia alni]|uniref:TetR/AcrR family transcriptional regulator n=1 Tax=Nocardia alni TaxID=2815723 RepID=UPI001C21F739|nr:TetR/AcrR family transcriptional regulator [Nocardia alni]
MTSSTPRPLRSDARRNRARLLDAAREMFAAHGVDVAMADIARHAGVSNGTLYNRFPAREDLIEAVFVDRLESLAALAERAAADPDPWRGFVAYLTGMCELQAGDRGFNEIAARGMRSPAVQPLRAAAYDSLTHLFDRAKRGGALRADASIDDLAFVVWGISRTVEATREYAPDAWRRHLALLVDGFRAEGASPLPESGLPRH